MTRYKSESSDYTEYIRNTRKEALEDAIDELEQEEMFLTYGIKKQEALGLNKINPESLKDSMSKRTQVRYSLDKLKGIRDDNNKRMRAYKLKPLEKELEEYKRERYSKAFKLIREAADARLPYKTQVFKIGKALGMVEHLSSYAIDKKEMKKTADILKKTIKKLSLENEIHAERGL